MKRVIKNKIKVILFSLFFVCFLLPFVLADSVGNSDITKGKVVYTPPEAPINYSLIPTVNSTVNWVTSIGTLNDVNNTHFDNEGGELTIDQSWLSTFGNVIWCALTGCTMAGDIQMLDNDINGSGDVSAENLYAISPDGSENIVVSHDNTNAVIASSTMITYLRTSAPNTDTQFIVRGRGTGIAKFQVRSGNDATLWGFQAGATGGAELNVNTGTSATFIRNGNVPVRWFISSPEGTTQYIRQYGFGTGCEAKSYLQREVEVDACDTTTWSGQEQYRFKGDVNVTGTLLNEAIYCESSELVDQVFTTAGLRYRLNISNVDEGNGITMETGINGTNISIDTSGVYHLVAQPQVKAGAGGAGDFHMWLEKYNTTDWDDISDSNIELKLSSLEEDVIVLATTLKLNQGEKIRLVASVSDDKILLHAQSPAGEPVIPSIIFTMYRVGS